MPVIIRLNDDQPQRKRRPRTVLGMACSREGMAIFRKHYAAARQMPKRRTAPEDIVAAFAIIATFYCVSLFDTSAGIGRGPDLRLMQDRMIGIIIGLVVTCGSLIAKVIRTAGVTDNHPDREA